MKKKLPTKLVSKIDHLQAGQRIRALRESRGMSVRRLAKEMGFTAPFVSDLELGRRNWTKKKFDLAIEVLGGAK